MFFDFMVLVKVGVIGIGNMGWYYVWVFSFLWDVDLVGVVDLDVECGKFVIE